MLGTTFVPDLDNITWSVQHRPNHIFLSNFDMVTVRSKGSNLGSDKHRHDILIFAEDLANRTMKQ